LYTKKKKRKNLFSLEEVFKELKFISFQCSSLGLHILLFYKHFFKPPTEAQQSNEQASQTAQKTLKVQSFVSYFEISFVGLSEVVRPSNFGKCLKIPQQ
jgi:hypothetical protein